MKMDERRFIAMMRRAWRTGRDAPVAARLAAKRSSPSRPGPGVRLGIGDDAAVVRFDAARDVLLKADMIVEGVHFDRRTSREREWGWKAAAANVSDIAAMGGVPRFALVSIGVPASFSLGRAARIARGIADVCRVFGVRVVGGDTTRSDRVVISVALAGEVEKGRAVTRAGARTGDVVFVTGPLGGSLRSGRHLGFTPRLAESRFLMRRFRPHAMIDVSDGLAKDLGHLAAESRVGLRIFESLVPLAPGVRSVDPAFLDGEDFELVFTLAPPRAAALLKDGECRRRGFNFYPIGRVVMRSKGLRITGPAGSRPFPAPRDHHFGRAATALSRHAPRRKGHRRRGRTRR